MGCRAALEVMEQGGGHPTTTTIPSTGCGFGSVLPTLLCGHGDMERTLGDM